MIHWRSGVVRAVARSWPGVVELVVVVDRPVAGTTEPEVRALAYVDVVGDPDPSLPGPLVKARYTPMQVSVQGADEQGSPGHETLREADDLTGLPVVVADLHSALPAVLAGLLLDRPGSAVMRAAPEALVREVLAQCCTA